MLGLDKSQLVVVDDEQYICNIITECLADEGYAIATFCDPRQALEFIENNSVDIVLTDLVMGEYSGVQVVEKALSTHEDAIVILMTAHPTLQTAISVLKRGAYDFLVKPFKLDLLRATVRRGLNHQKVIRDNLNLRGQVEFLKAAKSSAPGDNLTTYLQMVLKSSMTELSATAAAVVTIQSSSNDIDQIVVEADDPAFREELLDLTPTEELIKTGNKKPLIRSEKIVYDGNNISKIMISQPIVLGSKCHGLINLLILSRFNRVNQGQLDVLSILASSAGSAIANQRLYHERKASYFQAIRGLANSIEARDPYTAGHTDRVTKLAELLARELGWDQQRLDNLIMGCTIHDIGKIGVPDSILNKPSKLTDQEMAQMQKHPSLGHRIVKGIALFKPAIPYIIGHHEQYDGSGYPRGLKGDDIPIEGRLLAVADTFDAIMSDRPYRAGAKLCIAIGELIKFSGTQFDPKLVIVFIEMIRQEKIDLRELYGREHDLSCLKTVSTETAPA